MLNPSEEPVRREQTPALAQELLGLSGELQAIAEQGDLADGNEIKDHLRRA